MHGLFGATHILQYCHGFNDNNESNFLGMLILTSLMIPITVKVELTSWPYLAATLYIVFTMFVSIIDEAYTAQLAL